MKTLTPKTKDAVLQIAAWQVGVLESPSGSNRQKYGESYGMNGVAWCMMFVWWVFREAGFNLYKTGSCTAFVNRYRAFSPGKIVTGGYKPGDIVFFDFAGKRKKTEHCGIVEAVDGGSVRTIEGNTGTASDANGGAVMRRTRRIGLVTCAIRPGYPD